MRGTVSRSPVKKPVPDMVMIHEMKTLKRELVAMKPRPVMWGDCFFADFRQSVTQERVQKKEEPPGRRIIVGPEPIDITVTPRPIPLISVTAGVPDSIGIPNSLAFIR
jgi:hypothetical protein